MASSLEGPEPGAGPAGDRKAALATSPSLLERARAREANAWERMFYLYKPMVQYWCSRYGIRGEDADDVIQDVFRELVASLDSYRADESGGTFRTWLRAIARNWIVTHLRRAGKQEHAAGGSAARIHLEQVADTHTDEEEPPEQIGELYCRALEFVRAEFEERTWQMFWQTTIDGRSPAAVAADLGVSAAAVRQAKSRVLRRLKEEVGDLVN